MAVVTVSPAGMFTVTGMPPLSGLGALTTRLMESDGVSSGPRAKSGMLTVTALAAGAVTMKLVDVVGAADAAVVAVEQIAAGVLETLGAAEEGHRVDVRSQQTARAAAGGQIRS